MRFLIFPYQSVFVLTCFDLFPVDCLVRYRLIHVYMDAENSVDCLVQYRLIHVYMDAEIGPL